MVPTGAMTVRSSPWMTCGEELHNCPRRQFVLVLSAAMEIETSLGERRLFRPGEVLFVEDLTGKGHRLHHVGDEEITIMLVPVADELVAPADLIAPGRGHSPRSPPPRSP